MVAFNIALNVVDIDSKASISTARQSDEIQQLCADCTSSAECALPPSVMYSSIDRTHDRTHRRKVLFDTSMCFSNSGAFAFLVSVSIEKFYDFIEEKKSQFLGQSNCLRFWDEPKLASVRYCSISVVLTI